MVDESGGSATPEQLRALGHPTRWRILRLCLDDAHTNQELADRLGVSPATMLRHVRTLVRTGFLAAEPVRTGERGALERPYRATRRTKGLTADLTEDSALGQRMDLALLGAHRAEMVEAGPAASRDILRGVLRLGPAAQTELHDRLLGLLDEFAVRDEPDGEPLSYLWSLAARQAVDLDLR